MNVDGAFPTLSPFLLLTPLVILDEFLTVRPFFVHNPVKLLTPITLSTPKTLAIPFTSKLTGTGRFIGGPIITPAVGTGGHNPIKVGPLKTHVPGIIGTAGKNDTSNAPTTILSPTIDIEQVVA